LGHSLGSAMGCLFCHRLANHCVAAPPMAAADAAAKNA